MKEDWEIQQEISEKIYDFYYEKLKFCGCGRPDFTLMFIKDILNAIKTKTDNYDLPDYDSNRHKYYDKHQENLMNIFEFKQQYDDKTEFSINQDGIIQFVLYYLDEVGVLEHGSSIGGAWLSEYGKEILKCLNECEDLENVLN